MQLPALRDAAALVASAVVVVSINPIDLVRVRLFSQPTTAQVHTGAAVTSWHFRLHHARRRDRRPTRLFKGSSPHSSESDRTRC